MRAHFFRSFFCNFTRLLYELITAFALLQTSLNDYFISFPHGHFAVCEGVVNVIYCAGNLVYNAMKMFLFTCINNKDYYNNLTPMLNFLFCAHL